MYTGSNMRPCRHRRFGFCEDCCRLALIAFGCVAIDVEQLAAQQLGMVLNRYRDWNRLVAEVWD